MTTTLTQFRNLFEIYRGFFRTSLAVQFQYRVAMLIWLLGGIMEPLVYLVVWTTVARQQGGAVGGFTVPEFAAYYIGAMLVNHAVFTWIMWEYDYRIRSGEFSAMLLRPVHPIHSDIADNLAYKVLTLAVMLPAALLLAWIFQPRWAPQPWALALFPLVLILAFFTRFFLDWSLAMAAFWTTRINAINQAYFVVLIFFAGRVAPLDLFPEAVQRLALVLPFRWMLAFPVELILGRLTLQEALAGMGAQLLWIGIGLVLARTVYRAGIRRYAAFGA